METKKHTNVDASEFNGLEGIEYFKFEEDFVEANVRCIPMIVRFKMDRAGIKLKLSEWSKFSVPERIELALNPCENEIDVQAYSNYLSDLVKKYTGNDATSLVIDNDPEWSRLNIVPEPLQEKLRKFSVHITTGQWRALTNLQRFALLKLMKEGHENKNFPKAIKEFNLDT
jgi:hypothetical protein